MAEEISSDVIKKTQKLLGKYVKKPALTEKLLKKPPFRFLHDIVISVIKDTGFFKGLFSPEELVSENVKEKDAKIDFLNKLIDAVKIVTKTDLTVRASKVVAGLEPTKTNLLLQAIGRAIDDKIDTSAYVSQLRSGKVDAADKKLKKSTLVKDAKVKTSKTKSKDDSATKASKTKKINESPKNKTTTSTPRDSSRSKSKVSKKDSPKQPDVIKEEVNTPKENTSTNITTDTDTDNRNDNSGDRTDNVEGASNREIVQQESATPLKDADNVNITVTEDGNNNFENKETKHETQSLVRPKSARPKNGSGNALRWKSGNVDQIEVQKPSEMATSQPHRPKSSLRPPSVRPSSARPGAPRLRPDSALPLQDNVVMGNINVIVENVDNIDDEETVVIQTTSETTEEHFSPVEMSQDNKGQLVEQILEQIHEEGEGLKKKVDIDWEQDGLHGKDGAAKEIGQLRSLIQTLTKTANPLGKLMNYLHEDIDAMHAELQMWTNIKSQLFADINKQKRLSVESNKPLLAHLDHLREDIRKQQQEIINVRSNILRNESRIKELLNI